jgi:DnaJ domain
MPPPLMNRDPEGYYARLGVDPWCMPETVTAAYRRKARLVHPDVPGTGDANAFVALKLAYDVLISPERRSAYDRSAVPRLPAEPEPGEIGATPFPEMVGPQTRHPRLRDLPVVVWAGMVVLLIVGMVEIGLHLRTTRSTPVRDPIPATARDVPPAAPDEPAQPTEGPAPVRLAGTPNFYIEPTSSPTMLWRADEQRHMLVPWGPLPPFTAVQGLRLLKSSGMVEVKVTDSTNGYIEAGRLTPGDSATAARAWCSYHSGPTPSNGEVLTQNGRGGASLSIENRSGQPAVVKVRSMEGTVIASVFVGPGGAARMEGLPEERARLEFATGEAWSRACHGFSAGMRATRLASFVTLGGASQLAIPPDPEIATIELPDQAFEQE